MSPGGDFEIGVTFVLGAGVEGGFSNDPDDPGGATNRGISLRAVRLRDHDRDGLLDFDLDRDGDVDEDDMRLVSEADARRVLVEDYWQPSRAFLLPRRLAIAVFDAAVNCGPRVAVALLQRALGLKEDGIVGPKTVAAATRDPEALARYGAARARFYLGRKAKNGSPSKYIDGWLKRTYLLAEYLGGVPL